MAWASVVAGEPPPALQDPISVVDVMEVLSTLPQMMHYQMCMQGLAASGQIDASFVLLAYSSAIPFCSLLSNAIC